MAHSVQKNPSREADSSLPSQEMHRILWKLKFHFRFQNRQPPSLSWTKLTDSKPFHTITERFIPRSLQPQAQVSLERLGWCHKSVECAKSCARRSVCFCSQSVGSTNDPVPMQQLQSSDWGGMTVRLVRLALKVVMHNYGDLVDVIVLYFKTVFPSTPLDFQVASSSGWPTKISLLSNIFLMFCPLFLLEFFFFL